MKYGSMKQRSKDILCNYRESECGQQHQLKESCQISETAFAIAQNRYSLIYEAS